jgi:hypothetical protein
MQQQYRKVKERKAVKAINKDTIIVKTEWATKVLEGIC